LKPHYFFKKSFSSFKKKLVSCALVICFALWPIAQHKILRYGP
jgi:hypothetical protein